MYIIVINLMSTLANFEMAMINALSGRHDIPASLTGVAELHTQQAGTVYSASFHPAVFLVSPLPLQDIDDLMATVVVEGFTYLCSQSITFPQTLSVDNPRWRVQLLYGSK